MYKRQLLYSAPELLTPGDARGDAALRQALAEYLSEYRGVQCLSLIHICALCKKGAVAFLMPPFAKSDLFKGVVMGGVLPRKTFSISPQKKSGTMWSAGKLRCV